MTTMGLRGGALPTKFEGDVSKKRPIAGRGCNVRLRSRPFATPTGTRNKVKNCGSYIYAHQSALQLPQSLLTRTGAFPVQSNEQC